MSDTIYFSKASVDYGFLSNLYPARFTVDGVDYKSTEHFFQAAKARHFQDEDILRKILDCEDPTKVKAIGKKVKPFNRKEWDDLKEQVMKTGNMHKYSDPTLQQKLLATSERPLAECVRRDFYWGIGTSKAKAEQNGKYPGKNIMGIILEEVRQHYQEKAHHDELRKDVLGG